MLRVSAELITLLLLALPASDAAAQDAPPPDPAADAGSADGSAGDAGATDAAAGDAGPTEAAGPQISLATPRDTVRSFLVTMQVAGRDRPELIDSALACLDLSGFDDDERERRSRRSAAELFDVLDHLGIELEEIPTAPGRRRVVLRTFHPAEEGAPDLSITLERSQDGQNGQNGDGDGEPAWRFSWETITALPGIAAILQQQADERQDSGAEVVHAALRSPRAVMQTFLDAMETDPPDLARAADCLYPPEDSSGAWPVLKHDYAYRLYAVLLRARAPVLSTIPDPARGARYTWFVHGRGRIVIERSPEDNAEEGIWRGEWRFSQSTMSNLGDLYAAYTSAPLLPEVEELGLEEHLSRGLMLEQRIPSHLRVEVFGLETWKWLGGFFLVLFGGIVFWLVNLGARVSFAFARRIWHLGSDGNDRTEERMASALGYAGMFFVLHRFVSGNLLLLPARPLTVLYPLTASLIAGSLALFCLRIVELSEEHYQNSQREPRAHAARLVAPLLKSFFRLAIAAVGAVFVLNLLGFSQSAVIGSLGILGAAVGFAAKESISNTVAALSIVYDRPFRVGDWINFNGVDATVEHLGLVSVRMRTFYNSLVVVPNAQIITTSVDNYGERRYRRLRHFLRLRYDTPAAKIDALCEGLRELVRLHPYTRKDYYHIYLNELTPSSANVLIYVFFEVPDWATELRERHRFLVDSLALVEEMGIGLAYPTQRLLVEQVDGETAGDASPGRPDALPPGSPEAEGRQMAREHFLAAYGPSPERPPPVVFTATPLTAGMDDDGDGPGDGEGGGGTDA